MRIDILKKLQMYRINTDKESENSKDFSPNQFLKVKGEYNQINLRFYKKNFEI